MGDIYKGLTIRIGAETSELKKALRSSNTAINDTQKQLRKLAQAAKLDPHNVSLINQEFDLMGDKARALTSKLTDMREELAVMKKRLQGIKGTNAFDELAVSTQDAALKAAKAKQEYAEICDQIRRYKNAISSAAGVDEKIWKNIEEGSEAAKDKIRELSKTTEQAEANVARYEKMVAVYFERLKKFDLADLVNDIKNYETKVISATIETREFYRQIAAKITSNPTATMSSWFQGLLADMKRLEAEADALSKDLRTLDDALNLDPHNVDAARLKLAAMREQIGLGISQVKILNEELDLLRASGADKVAGDFADIRQEIIRAESEVGELRRAIDLCDKAMEKADGAELLKLQKRAEMLRAELVRAEAELNDLGNGLRYINAKTDLAKARSEIRKLVSELREANAQTTLSRSSLQQLGWAMYSTLTPAMMMFGSSAIQAAEDVDAAYRDMRKTVEGTEEQFESLKQAAIDYSRTHVTDAATLLEIEAMGGQLGVATENLEDFATTVSNLEIATNLDADTASEQLGQLQAILNDMTQDDFAKFGDALVRLGNNNAALEDKIMDVTLRIASMGTITGFTATELLSWATAIAATGQGAESSGTAISKTMSDIETAVSGGGEALDAFASAAGMSASEFAKTWNEAPSDAMKAFVEGLKRIEESGGSADQTLIELGITSDRQKTAIKGLMQTVEGLNANLEMSENAWNGVSDDWGAAGDAAREAERKAEGFSGAIKTLSNSVDALGVEMGESLTPALVALSDFVAGVTKLYSSLPEGGKWLADFVVAAGALSGPVLVGFNAVRNAGSEMVQSIMDGKEAFAAVAEEGMEVIMSTEGLAEALGITATGADGTAKKFDDMTKKEKFAAVATKALGTALKGLTIAVTVAALAYCISKLVDYAKYVETARKATEGFSEAVDLANSGLSGVDASAYVDSAKDVIASADEMTKANAEFADELKDVWGEVNDSNALVGKYAEIIEELGWQSGLSATDQVRLRAAVDGMNEVCGKTYQVIDAANGKLSESTDAILENAEAWMLNAKQQAAYQSAQDTLAQLVDTENELAIVQAKIAEEAAALNEAEQYNLYGDADPGYLLQLYARERQLIAERDQLNETVDSYTSLAAGYITETQDSAAATSLYTEEVEALIEGLNSLSEDNAFFNELLADSGMTVEDLALKMDTAGISIDSLSQKMEEYAGKTADAFNKIETVSDVSLQTMLDTLEYNTETTRNWSSNLAKLYAKAGEDSQHAFIDYIAGMGVEYAPIVQQLLDDNTGMLEELTSAWVEADKAGADAGFAETQRAVEEATSNMQTDVGNFESSLYDSTGAMELALADLGTAVGETAGDVEEGASSIAQSLLAQEPEVNAASKVLSASINKPLEDAAAKSSDLAYDYVSGYAGGIDAFAYLATNAAWRLGKVAVAATQAAQQSNSPSKVTWKLGQDYDAGYAGGIEDDAHVAIDAAEELVDDTLDMLATSESGAWTHGYHAAINYADGLASGSGAVKEAAGSLKESAEDEMDAFIANLAAQYKQAQLVAKEGSKLLTDIMWGSIYPATLDYEFTKPVTEDVYASMKTLEAAGYDLDSYMKKYDEYQEKYEEWQVKRKRGEVNTDSEKNSYADFKAEYDAFMKMADSVSDIDRLQEWHGLYTVKDDLITGIDAAEDWSDSLTSLFNKTGVVYSENFVEAMVNGGEEYQSALRKMAGMTADQVQEMVDSFDDLALAEREQEINARSLWVNSMPEYVKSSKEMMLDFREVCLDVKEAMYSDSGLAKAFAYTGTEVVNLALDLQSLEVDMATFAANANSYAMQVADGFNAMTTYNQTGLAEWERNLKANIVSSNQWKDDINEVFSKVDPAIDSEAFRQAVYSEGFETWGQVMADMANMTSEQITGYIELYNEAIATGLVNATETFDDLAPGDELMEAAIEGLSDTIPLLEQTALEAGKAGAASALTTLPEWVTTGQNLAGGIASGIQSQIGSIAAAAAATVRAAIAAAKAEAEIASPSKVMRDEVGYMLGMGMAVGMDRSQAKVALASTLAVETAVNAAKRSIALNGVSAQVAAANGFAAARAASVTNNSTTNDNRSYSSPVTVSIQATIREDADITKLAKEINKVQQRALRAGGNA